MEIFNNCFDKMKSEDAKTIKQYFKGYDYQSAGYTFLSNFVWRNAYCVCWEIIGKYLCLAGTDCIMRNTKAIVAMPMTKDGKYNPEDLRYTILEAKKRFEKRNIQFSIELIPEHMLKFLEEAFPGELEIIHDRDDDEYVYLKEKLINLSGRDLHKKKNHLNYFVKTYQYEYKNITKAMVTELKEFVENLKLNKNVTDIKELETLELEERAIGEMLQYVDDENVFAGAIFVDGKIEAFSIGELLSNEMAVAHFEKANDKYRGIYQVINSEFCKHLPESVIYVNREEDMGLENLRHAKESYRPDHMIKKYIVKFKN